jgi:predicted transposase YbfD/YdcC
MKERVSELGEVIAVDGKAIRSTTKKDKPHSALQIITAYATESGVTLAQKAVHEKTNEIPVLQEMLGYLQIDGKTITADAMHCQKETCARVVEGKGDYLFGLKENQKCMYDNVREYFEDKINDEDMETSKTVEKSRGRIEERICRKSSNVAWLNPENEWKGLRNILEIKRKTDTNGTKTEETSYYITSSDKEAGRLMEIVRSHWEIETLHWLLDVTLNEDECRLHSESAQKTINIFRKLAILYHKKYRETLTEKQRAKTSIKATMRKCSMNDKLLQIILLSL